MLRPEQALQRAVRSYLDAALPDGSWWSGINNNPRSPTHGAILKGMGCRAGIPDIHITWRSVSHWIELKAARGAVSSSQRREIARLEVAGARVAVCRSVEDVEAALVKWGIPLKMRILA